MDTTSDMSQELYRDDTKDDTKDNAEILNRQAKRRNARKEAKRIARRVGINMKKVPRKERRSVAFGVIKQQLKDGRRKGDEYKNQRENPTT